MDKKISQSDNSTVIELTLNRQMSFKENFEAFSISSGFPLTKDGNINYESNGNRCVLVSIELENGIEIGYFDYKLDKTVHVNTLESTEDDLIALTFNFGSGLNRSEFHNEEVTKEGITNSIFINNAIKIKEKDSDK